MSAVFAFSRHSPVTSTNNDGEFRNFGPSHRPYHLGSILRDPTSLGLFAHHVTRHIDQEQEWDPALRAKLNEMRRFERRGREQDTGISDYTDCMAVYLCETRNEGFTVFTLEFAKFGAVRDSSYDFAHVVCLPWVCGDNRIEVGRGVERWLDLGGTGVVLRR